IDDAVHVIAQGQENSARDKLSFIERAVFAQKLIDLDYDRETVQAALSTDNPMLTRMLSVTKRVPLNVIDIIGSAKAVGRDRWTEFASQYEQTRGGELKAYLQSPEFTEIKNSDDRFAKAFDCLKGAAKTKTHKVKLAAPVKSWTSQDKSVNFTMNRKPKKVDVSFKSDDA
ncbi:plasmid partitioning protein RepB C-terminal domain-containing protein, partial [Ochrobactrum sp. SFR4]|uniref:plasmid partitioning protein RepB C-terminal domain-containing protein n=1 Tax=Ochrobactrum sp. SFR4 TaxID=2717368 RepID=UPI0025706EA0